MSQIIPLFKRIAQKNSDNPGDGRKEKFFMFKFEKKTFAIPAVDVTEVVVPVSVVPVPAQPYVVGVVNIRGNVVPVVNIRDRISMSFDYVIDDNSRILLFTIKQGSYVGIVADSIGYRLKEGIVEPIDTKSIEKEKVFRYAVIENEKFPVFFIDTWLDADEFEALQKITSKF